MKEIKAIIQPFMLEHVLDALRGITDLPGLTLSKVLGWGRTRAVGAPRTVHESGHAFAEKIKLEIIVEDELVEMITQVIVHAAQTGNPGDGKVFVHDLDSATGIRRGEVLYSRASQGDIK